MRIADCGLRTVDDGQDGGQNPRALLHMCADPAASPGLVRQCAGCLAARTRLPQLSEYVQIAIIFPLSASDGAFPYRKQKTRVSHCNLAPRPSRCISTNIRQYIASKLHHSALHPTFLHKQAVIVVFIDTLARGNLGRRVIVVIRVPHVQ